MGYVRDMTADNSKGPRRSSRLPVMYWYTENTEVAAKHPRDTPRCVRAISVSNPFDSLIIFVHSDVMRRCAAHYVDFTPERLTARCGFFF